MIMTKAEIIARPLFSIAAVVALILVIDLFVDHQAVNGAITRPGIWMGLVGFNLVVLSSDVRRYRRDRRLAKEQLRRLEEQARWAHRAAHS